MDTDHKNIILQGLSQDMTKDNRIPTYYVEIWLTSFQFLQPLKCLMVCLAKQ